MSANEWTADQDGSPETWHLCLDATHDVYGYASRYSNGQGYNWQAVRREFRMSGSTDTAEEAKAMAEQALALPVDEFNGRIADELIERFHKIERQILELRPDTLLLPGYSVGYENGVADTRRKIEEALA